MQIFIVASLLAVAIANEVAYPAYPKPKYPQAASYEKNKENYTPMPYNFDWSVYDQASYNDFSHQESSDGKIVTGSYRVLLPDSRIQIVTYKADEYGYVADVKYEGEAKYDNKPYSGSAYNQPKYQSEYANPADNAKQSYPSPPPYTPAKYPESPSTSYNAQPAYNKPGYPTKQYTESQQVAYNKPAYPAKQYTEANPSSDYKPQSAYPAAHTPAKQYSEEYPSKNYKPQSAHPATYTPSKPFTESHPTNDYKPTHKAAPAAAQSTYNQPKYPAGDYTEEVYSTSPKYESYPTTTYATKKY